MELEPGTGAWRFIFIGSHDDTYCAGASNYTCFLVNKYIHTCAFYRNWQNKINASLEINRRTPKGLHSRSARLLGTIRYLNFFAIFIYHISIYYLAPHRGRARYCNAHACLFVCLFVCVFVCLFVCLFVCVFAKFQSVISQPFLNRSLWNLAYILRMGTPWLTNIFRILGQRSRS